MAVSAAGSGDGDAEAAGGGGDKTVNGVVVPALLLDRSKRAASGCRPRDALNERPPAAGGDVR